MSGGDESMTALRGGVALRATTLGDGPRIVLVQFFRRNTLAHYQQITPRLTEAGFSLAALDPRGVGGNDGSLEGLTLHELAADVAAVMDALECGPAHVLSTAYATSVARCLAADRPDLVRTLILCSPGAIGEPFSHQPAADTLERYASIFFGASFDSDDRRQAIQDVAYGSSGARADAHDYEVRDVDATALLAAAQATDPKDWWAAGEAVPMLVVQGLRDQICRYENSRALRDELHDRVELAEIPEAGHMTLQEKPDEFTQVVLRFLGAHTIDLDLVLRLDLVAAYRDARTRLLRLVHGLDDQQVSTSLSACPGWTVRDVVAHLIAIAAEIPRGSYPDPDNLAWKEPALAAARDEWTAAGLARRRGHDIESLLAEWEELEPGLVEFHQPGGLPAGHQPWVQYGYVPDVTSHLHDIRHALSIPGDREALCTMSTFAVYRAALDVRLRELAAPAIRLRTKGQEWIEGEGTPAATMSSSPFELYRAIGGRRSWEQILAYEWEGDAEQFRDVIALYPLAAEPLVEQ